MKPEFGSRCTDREPARRGAGTGRRGGSPSSAGGGKGGQAGSTPSHFRLQQLALDWTFPGTSLLNPHRDSPSPGNSHYCPVRWRPCNFVSTGLAPSCAPAVHRRSRHWGGLTQSPDSGPGWSCTGHPASSPVPVPHQGCQGSVLRAKNGERGWGLQKEEERKERERDCSRVSGSPVESIHFRGS